MLALTRRISDGVVRTEPLGQAGVHGLHQTRVGRLQQRDARAVAHASEQGEETGRVGRRFGLSVPNARTEIGVNTSPVPSPWMNPVEATMPEFMFRANPLIAPKDSANTPRPVTISARASTRLMMRPTTNIETMLPRPRGAVTTPVVSTG